MSSTEPKTSLARLAGRLLGKAAGRIQPRSFARIEAGIIPERGQVQDKTFTSEPDLPGDIEVLPEYEFVLQAVQQGCPAIFVTGKAGTGKSTLIRWLRAQLKSCAVVAPTAIAAASVQGETIHAFFGIPPRLVDAADELRLSSRARMVLANISCLVVDEVSMVTPNLVDLMSQRLQVARDDARPFGGVPVVFVGDLLQLPPVVSTREAAVYFSHRYKTRYFFSADVFSELQIIPLALTRIYRQADGAFVDALNRIRWGQDCREAVALFNRACWRDAPRDAPNAGTRLVPTNQAARRLNARELARLPGGARLYEARVEGQVPAHRWQLTVPEKLELKVGARVVFLRNHRPDWINGHQGVVLGLEEDAIRVRKDETDNVVVVGRATWQRYKYRYDYRTRRVEAEVVGSFEQFPLAPGWAITIHKSQGLTLDRLTLDLGAGAFAEGQTYVALSRARTLDGIRLSRPISMADVQVDPLIIRFYRELDVGDD